mmetsp:Transcript_26324/g.39874  ORF Transcript_26324/g.39874 Transcript_26324/m.39874 type:complete len:324 (+) Transcript_26324:157-1128(+)|eukprot:CAMPEP_0178902846 /NCGR_PEP_ID=MMETSP0786-20121207/4831_1 /TAXON_ID=186022 /ORGANISM="Thalassionema frauenfeldii, Strain CCMP 1798" /LENGTH=323 /DNA_ID=CAMNT_0020574157 /DNA_START=112 /DNA_END=1083 /DNA_ORIENTATION=+
MSNINCEAPDACINDEREENLLSSQQRNDGRSQIRRVFERDRILIIAALILILLLNFETGRYVLYPFELFTTWVHEMCHGTAAVLVGGSIGHMKIFQDGSGLCTYSVGGVDWKSGVVSSAGYTGAAFWGCILLLFRRTTLGPTIGTITCGILIILSCIMYVRNEFGIIVLSIEGIVLLLSGWLLPAVILDHIFSFLGVACSLNAIEDIQNLYGSEQGYVDGEKFQTDAHQVSEYWGNDYTFWATAWLIFGIVMTLIGVVLARDARSISTNTGWSASKYQVEPPPDYSATFFNGYRVRDEPSGHQKANSATTEEGVAYWKQNPV